MYWQSVEPSLNVAYLVFTSEAEKRSAKRKSYKIYWGEMELVKKTKQLFKLTKWEVTEEVNSK